MVDLVRSVSIAWSGVGGAGLWYIYISFSSSSSPFYCVEPAKGVWIRRDLQRRPVVSSSFSWFAEHGGAERPGPGPGATKSSTKSGGDWLKFCILFMHVVYSEVVCSILVSSAYIGHSTFNSNPNNISRVPTAGQELSHPCPTPAAITANMKPRSHDNSGHGGWCLPRFSPIPLRLHLDRGEFNADSHCRMDADISPSLQTCASRRFWHNT